MSRSNYDYDDGDEWAMIRWRGAVTSAIRGKRGQAFLRELRDALDAMPEKILIADELIDAEGDVCAIGTVGIKRGIDLKVIDPDDYDSISKLFDIPKALVREIEFENDEAMAWLAETPQQRWARIRRWVVAQIKEPT